MEFIKCPVCSSAANEQTSDPSGPRKFICRRLGCLEIFQVSRPQAVKTPEQVVADKIEKKAAAAGINLEDRVDDGRCKEYKMIACSKGCGKEFKHEAWKVRHEEKCDGTAKRVPKDPLGESRPRKKAVTSSNGSMDDIIAELKKKREVRVQDLIGDDPDIKALDIAIDALENRPQ